MTVCRFHCMGSGLGRDCDGSYRCEFCKSGRKCKHLEGAPLPACLSKDAPAAESGEGESLLHRMKEEARATANKMADEAKAEALRLYKTAVHIHVENIDFQSNADPGLKFTEPKEATPPPLPPVRQPQPFVPWTEEVMNDAVLAYVRRRISEAGVKLLARRQSLDPSYCENAEHELSHWQGVLKYVEEKLK